MREPQNRTIDYCGYATPSCKEEVEFEILGLKNLIKKAEEKITLLEQTKFLVEHSIAKKNKVKNEDLHDKESKR
jgi:hypothetical protein